MWVSCFFTEPNNPKKVLVKKLVLVSEGQTEKTLDLSGDLSKLKQTVFTIKEGVQYRIRIEFFVQHEIVTGLKYVQKTYRKGIPGTKRQLLKNFHIQSCLTSYLLFIVDKMTQMVGSYAPKKELQSYTTPVEDAPSGMLARGHYTVNSLFTDDDGHEHLKVYSIIQDESFLNSLLTSIICLIVGVVFRNQEGLELMRRSVNKAGAFI